MFNEPRLTKRERRRYDRSHAAFYERNFVPAWKRHPDWPLWQRILQWLWDTLII